MEQLTLEQAKNLVHGEVLHILWPPWPNRRCQRWRVNGKVKLWKRNLSRVEVPVKWGLYTYGYLTEGNLHRFHLEGACEGKV